MSTFEVIRGVEGCCLALDDTRIAGPKPWGGGSVAHSWQTDKEYGVLETCKNIAPDYLDFLCNKCGFVHYHSDENDTGDGNDWNYCPNCGRKVKR